MTDAAHTILRDAKNIHTKHNSNREAGRQSDPTFATALLTERLWQGPLDINRL